MYFHALVLCLRAALHGALSVQTWTESSSARRRPKSPWCGAAVGRCASTAVSTAATDSSRDVASWRTAATSLWWPRRPQPCRSGGRLPERGSARPRQRCCSLATQGCVRSVFSVPSVSYLQYFLGLCVSRVPCPVLCCAKAFLHWISNHCFSGAEKALFLCSNPPLKSSKNHCTCDVSVDWNEMTYRQVWEVLSGLFSSIYHNTGLPNPAQRIRFPNENLPCQPRGHLQLNGKAPGWGGTCLDKIFKKLSHNEM